MDDWSYFWAYCPVCGTRFHQSELSCPLCEEFGPETAAQMTAPRGDEDPDRDRRESWDAEISRNPFYEPPGR